MNVDITDLKTVRLSQDGSAVIILDQTCLPGSEVYVPFLLQKRFGRLYID